MHTLPHPMLRNHTAIGSPTTMHVVPRGPPNSSDLRSLELFLSLAITDSHGVPCRNAMMDTTTIILYVRYYTI